jgi:hypothetical protein
VPAFYAFLIASAVVWAIPRTARAQLYVANQPSLDVGIVSEYDTVTGAVLNSQLITGLAAPNSLLVDHNILFVTDGTKGTVGKYDATTGDTINPSLITGFRRHVGLAVD